MQHWFWFGLCVAAVGWYLAVTMYVAVRGAQDIKHMFRRLEQQIPAKDQNAVESSDKLS